MIVGIGTDIIEIDRIKKAVEKTTGFLEKIFTKKEIEMFSNRNMRFETIAGNFAAKEAVVKALGTGMRGISFIDIEVLRDELGKPYVNLSNKIKEKYPLELNIFISISHNKENAVSFVLIESKWFIIYSTDYKIRRDI